MKRFEDIVPDDPDNTKSKKEKPKKDYPFKLISRGSGDLKTRYRPRKLEELAPTCQVEQLKNIIKDPSKASQVHLLEGLTGCGKTTCARILAKAMVCLDSDYQKKPCLNCSNCQEFDSGICMDLTEMNVANRRKIDDMRSLVEEMQFRPQTLGKLIYILDEVQQLTPEAQQLLLKVLEEPHSHLLIFLCTTDKRGLDKALIDRANEISFHQVSAKDAGVITNQILENEGVQASDEIKESFFLNCQGSVRALMNNIQIFLDGGEKSQATDELIEDDNIKPLANALLKQDWDSCKEVLKNNFYIKKNPESIRIQLENYFRAIVLKSDKNSLKKPAMVLKHLLGTTNNEAPISQYNWLVYKCACACEKKD